MNIILLSGGSGKRLYTVMDVQPGSMTIKISMKAGEKMSYHMHSEREEVWTVVSGKGKAIVDDREKILCTGDVITISAGCKHTVEARLPETGKVYVSPL